MVTNRAKVIAPYSDKSRWTPNAKTFPALKHFWPCNETSGTKWYEVITGGYFYPGSTDGVTFPNGSMGFVNNGVIIPGRNGGFTSGPGFSLTPPGSTGSCLGLAVGIFSTGEVSYGKLSSLGGMGLGPDQNVCLTDGVNIFSGISFAPYPGSDAVNVHGRGVTANWDTLTYQNFFATDTTFGQSLTKAIILPTSIPAIETYLWTANMPVNGITIYGLEFWKFKGALPVDIEAMVTWTTNARPLGIKYPYPAWAGIT